MYTSRGSVVENLQMLQPFSFPPSNNQPQGQPGMGHSPAQLNYMVGHTPSGTNYSPGIHYHCSMKLFFTRLNETTRLS
jgi:hypothetical protein